MADRKILPVAETTPPGHQEDLRGQIRHLLDRHLPPKAVSRVLKDPQLTRFMAGVLRQHGPDQIRTLQVSEQHGNLSISVTLKQTRRQCVTYPSADGQDGQTHCATTDQIVSQQRLTYDRRALQRLVSGKTHSHQPPHPHRPAVPLQVASTRPSPEQAPAEATPPAPPVKKSLPLTSEIARLRREALEKAWTEAAGRTPSWEVVDVNPLTHEALIRHVATGGERWVVRDDLFPDPVKREKFFDWHIQTASDALKNGPRMELSVNNGQIIVRDNGNLLDDSFSITIDGVKLGVTKIGGLGVVGIELKKGRHRMDVEAVAAPDDLGTMEVRLGKGTVFADGAKVNTEALHMNERVTYYFIVR